MIFYKQQRLTIEDLVQIIEFETRDQYFSEAFFNIESIQSIFQKKLINTTSIKEKFLTLK